MSDDFRAIDDDDEELLDQWNLADDDSSRSSEEPRRRNPWKSSTASTSAASVGTQNTPPLNLDCSAVVQDFAVGPFGSEAVSIAGGRVQVESGGATTCVYDPDAEARDGGGFTLDAPPARFSLPGAGDVVGDFQLVIELGRGAFARVFLAEEVKLGRRLVALKVSKAEGDEPQILARLQHAHIVPVHSVHDDPMTGLRLLCMPFLGGANLAQVLEESGGSVNERATGKGFIHALDQLSQRLPGRAIESLSVSRKSIGRTPSRVRSGSFRRSLRRDLPAAPAESIAADEGRRAAFSRPSRTFLPFRRMIERLTTARARGTDRRG